VVENDFFSKLTKIQQRCDVDEYRHEWEALEIQRLKISRKLLKIS
jgi:hypothetical protein